MHFARQGSASQAYFMRQATIEEVFTIFYTPLFCLINFQGTDSVIALCVIKIFCQGSSAPSGVPHKSSGYERSCSGFEAPLFSRPVRKEPNLANGLPMVQGGDRKSVV